MLLAALVAVVIASCYYGDTYITTTGERVRLACIGSPELIRKSANPVPAKAGARRWATRQVDPAASTQIVLPMTG